jgi:hypothetical protein
LCRRKRNAERREREQAITAAFSGACAQAQSRGREFRPPGAPANVIVEMRELESPAAGHWIAAMPAVGAVSRRS